MQVRHLEATRLVASAFILALAACQGAAPNPERPKETCASGSASACARDCETGDDKACDTVTLMYLRGVDGDDEKAASLMKRLCESGRRRYCPSYAFALAQGKGTPKDEARARELFTTTCEYDPSACSQYGNLYAAGNGVPKDIDLAHLLLDLACTHLDTQACEELGQLLEYACGQGHGASCNELAILHSQSARHHPDEADVAELFRRGCDAGDGPACRNFALATAEGHGVPKDAIEADKLYAKACKLGSSNACAKKH